MLMSLYVYTRVLTHTKKLSVQGESVPSRQGLVLESKRQAGRHKVETSSDLAAINSLVICSCLPTLTTLVLGAVWSMGRGAWPL